MPTTRPANKKTKRKKRNHQVNSKQAALAVGGPSPAFIVVVTFGYFFLTVGARFYTAKYLLEDDIHKPKIQSPSTKKKTRDFL